MNHRIWLIVGLFAAVLAVLGTALAVAAPNPTGNDGSGGLFSAKLGL
jgi:hypothetical protein